MKIFRSKRPELSRGHWREKVSDLFGQTAHFSPVGSGRKKFPKKRTTSPVSVKWVLNEENLSFKTGETLQWVLREK